MEFSPLTSLFHANSSAILAAGGIAPDQIFGWFTNSIFVAIIVVVLVLMFARMATKKMALIPGKKQNLVEYVVEFLYGQVENIVGKKVAPKAFPLLATIFIFILVSNYSGLLPGVGTIGFGPKSGPLTIDMQAIDELHHGDHGAHGDEAHAEGGEAVAEVEVVTETAAETHGDSHAESGHRHAVVDTDVIKQDAEYWKHHWAPLLRPPTADLNLTLGIAAVFMLVWMWLTISEIGVIGFIKHTFGPKGGLTGFIKYALTPIFIFVGVIELISIAARPVSLSLRLLGNIFAGETLLHTMGELGTSFGMSAVPAFLMRVLLPIPFYFMEILVGLLQATVFALLCAVYIQLSTTHDEEAH